MLWMMLLIALVRLTTDTSDVVVRLKPDTADVITRLKPDTTDALLWVRLKPDTTGIGPLVQSKADIHERRSDTEDSSHTSVVSGFSRTLLTAIVENGRT